MRKKVNVNGRNIFVYRKGHENKHLGRTFVKYWKEYRRRNALRCREQRSEWREANRERIRLCARRSYYRKLLRLGQGDKQVINARINELDSQIMKILASEN